MSENENENENATPPPPPPSTPPPPPSEPPAGGGSSNRSIMLVLSYLWLLALIPLLVEKEDREVQWHAKHGIVLMVAEFLVWIVLMVLSSILSCLAGIIAMFVWLAIVILHVMMIVQALNGKRMLIPGLSHYADQF
ncbi:MAG: hypothetical protein D6696_14950 [Acidobacteria bacterium]|nr:MAG: hypothetical protein D6696_14950 [Acidobacteriota bacterium]